MEKKHIKDEELFFYVSEDLDSDTIDRIEQHIKNCALCRDRLARERILLQTLNSSEFPVPKKRELKKVRKKLKINLAQFAEKKAKKSFSFSDVIQWLFSPNVALRLAGGVAFFLVGLLTGLSVPESQDISVEHLLKSSNTRFEKISFQKQKNDKVKVILQHNIRQTLQLSADDPRLIQAAINILKHDDRDNMRLKAVKILQNAETKEAVEFALVESLQSDPNPGIRLQAIQILKKFPLNQKIKDVLVSVFFKDENSGIRYEARSHLEKFDENRQISSKKNLKT